MVKTVYDPSPVGFTLPASNAFSGFTIDGRHLGDVNGVYLNTGWYFYTNSTKSQTIFFPTSGVRYYTNGKRTDVNFYGDFWAATPGNAKGGYAIRYDSWGNIYTQSKDIPVRATGQGVRPVSE